MKKLIQAWNWFNGKKTLIGAAIITLTPKAMSYLIQLLTIWHLNAPAVTPQITASLLWFGTGLTLVGGVHKLIKWDPTPAAITKQ